MMAQMICRTLILTVEFLIIAAAVCGIGLLAMLGIYYFLITI